VGKGQIRHRDVSDIIDEMLDVLNDTPTLKSASPLFDRMIERWREKMKSSDCIEVSESHSLRMLVAEKSPEESMALDKLGKVCTAVVFSGVPKALPPRECACFLGGADVIEKNVDIWLLLISCLQIEANLSGIKDAWVSASTTSATLQRSIESVKNLFNGCIGAVVTSNEVIIFGDKFEMVGVQLAKALYREYVRQVLLSR